MGPAVLWSLFPQLCLHVSSLNVDPWVDRRAPHQTADICHHRPPHRLSLIILFFPLLSLLGSRCAVLSLLFISLTLLLTFCLSLFFFTTATKQQDKNKKVSNGDFSCALSNPNSQKIVKDTFPPELWTVEPPGRRYRTTKSKNKPLFIPPWGILRGYSSIYSAEDSADFSVQWGEGKRVQIVNSKEMKGIQFIYISEC